MSNPFRNKSTYYRYISKSFNWLLYLKPVCLFKRNTGSALATELMLPRAVGKSTAIAKLANKHRDVLVVTQNRLSHMTMTLLIAENRLNLSWFDQISRKKDFDLDNVIPMDRVSDIGVQYMGLDINFKAIILDEVSISDFLDEVDRIQNHKIMEKINQGKIVIFSLLTKYQNYPI